MGGIAGESEFNMCIESVKLFQNPPQPSESSGSKVPGAVSEARSENAPEEMKAAVNLCQRCQGLGRLQSAEQGGTRLHYHLPPIIS